MDDAFLESLLCAVGDFLGDVVLNTAVDMTIDAAATAISNRGTAPHPPEAHHGASPWSRTFERVGQPSVAVAALECGGIGDIRASDPTFDLGGLLVRVGQMFAAFHEAVDTGDLESTRSFIDGAYLQRISPLAERIGPRESGARTFTVRSIRAISAVHAESFDSVRIAISAQAAGDDELVCELWEVRRERAASAAPTATWLVRTITPQ